MDLINQQAVKYVQPILIIFGTLGAVANLILFNFRKPLRVNSCTLYFRALSCNDLLVLWIVILPQWLRKVFAFDLTIQYTWYCKLSTYCTYALYTLSPYFIVLACFDRLCASSTHGNLRHIATISIAQILIPCFVFIIFMMYIYVPIWFEILPTSRGVYCGIASPVYNQILSFSILLIFNCLPPSLMILFCIVTLIILRQQRHRIMPVNQTRSRHRDNQLLKILIIYVAWNIICVAPFTITYFREIYIHSNLSPFTSSIVQMFSILVNVVYASSFYMYTLGTPFYRAELLNLAKTCLRGVYQNSNLARVRSTLMHATAFRLF
jgi:hypothetical protein